MLKRTYPGRLTQQQWLKRTVRQRYVLAARAAALRLAFRLQRRRRIGATSAA